MSDGLYYIRQHKSIFIKLMKKTTNRGVFLGKFKRENDRNNTSRSFFQCENDRNKTSRSFL